MKIKKSNVFCLIGFSLLNTYPLAMTKALAYSVTETSSDFFSLSVLSTENTLQSILNDALNIQFYSISNNEINLSSQAKVENYSQIKTLQDGVYLVDRGHGWVLGEQDFIAKGYARNGNALSLEESTRTENTHSVKVTGGIGIKKPTIESMIKLSYGKSWTDIQIDAFNFKLNTIDDKDIYARLYKTHQRFDTIEVKNNALVSLTSSYSLTGSFVKQLHHLSGSYVDENKMFEKRERRVTDGNANLLTTGSNKTILFYDENGKAIKKGQVKVTAFELPFDEIQSVEAFTAQGYPTGDYLSKDEFKKALNKEVSTHDVATLVDGFYSVNLGDHWVRPDDEGVLHTMIIPENATGSYSETQALKFGQSEDLTLGSKFSFGLLQLLVEMSYGHSFSETFATKITTHVDTERGENAYVKIYSINERIDFVEIKNGKVVARTSTFKPTGYIAEDVKYANTLGYDQSQSYKKDGEKLFGIAFPKIGGLINHNSNYFTHNLGQIDITGAKEGGVWNSEGMNIVPKLHPWDFTVKFTVPKSGFYHLGHHIQEKLAYSLTPSEGLCGWVTDYEIWQVSPVNPSQGFKIADKKLEKSSLIHCGTWNYQGGKTNFDYYSGRSVDNAITFLRLEAGKSYAFVARDYQNNKPNGTYVHMWIAAKWITDLTDSDYKTVNFDSNGGGYVPSFKSVKGSTIFKSPAITRENYYLDGWYEDDDKPFYFGITPIASDGYRNLFLEAKWKPIDPNVEQQTHFDVFQNFPSSDFWVNYSSGFSAVKHYNAKDDSAILSKTKGNKAQFYFIGNEIEIFGKKGRANGDFNLYLDGTLIKKMSSYDKQNQFQVSLVKLDDLTSGSHVVTIETLSTKEVELDYAIATIYKKAVSPVEPPSVDPKPPIEPPPPVEPTDPNQPTLEPPPASMRSTLAKRNPLLL